MKTEIITGSIYNRNFLVKNEWAADLMGSGGVHVLGTPALIQAVEELAFETLQPLLDDDVTSVGTKVDITHLYPTAIGKTFNVELLLNYQGNNKVEFSVTAKCEDKVIASGIHRRAIVNTKKFLSNL